MNNSLIVRASVSMVTAFIAAAVPLTASIDEVLPISIKVFVRLFFDTDEEVTGGSTFEPCISLAAH